jgi:hypothetical protein
MTNPIPRLSLVVPTMGKQGGVLRMLDSIVYQAPASLLMATELIVFLNADPETKIDVGTIEEYLQKHGGVFYSTQFIRAEKFHLTAEESAFAAVLYSTGDYLWIVGDKRIFLPEGLAQLDKYIKMPATPCAYFNSVWYDSDGHSNAQASTHFSKNITTISYKAFVQGNGINYMATNMGTWVFQKQFLDPSIWGHIIAKCGPHFSHVATLLATMGQADVTCHATFLAILESKAYHAGNDNEWARYAKLANTYRYYAWTFGLARQLRYLVEQGIYSYIDVRRSMCSEGTTLTRQVDEIYRPLISQIWLGWLLEKERITQNEFDEIHLFLVQTCPERAVANGMLRRIYEESKNKTSQNFVKNLLTTQRAIDLDHCELRFSSMIIGQIGDKFIRLHPRGFLLSKVKDNCNFMLAYKLADAPLNVKNWRIIGDSELASLECEAHIQDIGALFPVHVTKLRPLIVKIKNKIRLIAKIIMQSSIVSSIVSILPRRLIAYIWKCWL